MATARELSDYNFTKLKGGNATDPYHAREYTPQEIGDLLEAGAFAVERMEAGPYGLQRRYPAWLYDR